MLESLFNKVATCKVIQKRLQQRCFHLNIAKFLRTPISKNICKRLLLKLLTLYQEGNREVTICIKLNRAQCHSNDFHCIDRIHLEYHNINSMAHQNDCSHSNKQRFTPAASNCYKKIQTHMSIHVKTMPDTIIETLQCHINTTMIKPQEILLCYVSGKVMIMAVGVGILITQKQSPRTFHKIGILKYFIKFTGKHLFRSLVLNEVAGFRPATILKNTCERLLLITER